MKEINLRDYQLHAVNHIVRQLRENQLAAGILATGSGKSIIGAAVASKLIEMENIDKVIIATPFNSIVHDFSNYSQTKLIGGNSNNWQTSVPRIDNIIDKQGKNTPDTLRIKDIIKALNGKSKGQIIVTSHAAMASDKIRDAVELIEDMSNILLIIDEAHHCFADLDEYDNELENEDEQARRNKSTELGILAEELKDRGGKILYLTATPYRNHGGETEIIFDVPEVDPYVRTIGEQIRAGYAPKITTNYINGDYEMDNFSIGDQVNSIISHENLELTLPIILDNWKQQGYPKAILLIPAGNAEELAEEVQTYFQKQQFPEDVAEVRGRSNPRVLIAVGNGSNFGHSVLEELDADKREHGHKYDLVLGCRKFDEGTDVPSASHLYMIGIPSNVRLFHQRVGRVARMKIGITGYTDWFGDKFIEQSIVTFIAPRGKVYREFDLNVGRQLLHCIFAGEAYAEYCESTGIGHDVRLELESRREAAKEDSEREILKQIAVRLANCEIEYESNYSEITYEKELAFILGQSQTVGDAMNGLVNLQMDESSKLNMLYQIAEYLPDADKKEFKEQLVLGLIALYNGLIKKSKKSQIVEMQHATLINPLFEDLLEQYRTQELKSRSDENVRAVFDILSGENLKDWGERFRKNFGVAGGLAFLKKIFDWMDAHNGKVPLQTGEEDEGRYGRKIHTMRRIKNGDIIGNFYPEYLELAIQRGYPEIFNKVDRLQEGIDSLNEIFDWMDDKNGTPPVFSKYNDEERRYANKLNQLRAIYLGKKKGIFYQDYLELAIRRGYPEIFNKVDRLQEDLDFLNKIFDWMDEHDHITPKESSIDQGERSYRIHINILRSAKAGKNNTKWHPEYLELAIERGYPNIFNKPNKLQEGIDFLNKIFDWMDEHDGRNPNSQSDDDYERKYANRINALKSIKSGNAAGYFFDEYLQLAAHRGYENIFSKKDILEHTLDNVKELLSWIINNEYKLPNSNVQEKSEKRLGRFLHGMRKAKANSNRKGGYIFRPIYQQMAEKINMPHLFDKVDRESKGSIKLKNLISIIKCNDGNPPNKNGTLLEKEMYKFLSELRSSKANPGKKGGPIFREIYQKMAEDAGYPNLFDKVDLDKKGKENVKLLIDWILDHNGKMPNENSDCDTEEFLCSLLYRLRRAKANPGSTSATFRPIYQQMAEDAKLPDLFDQVKPNKSPKSKTSKTPKP